MSENKKQTYTTPVATATFVHLTQTEVIDGRDTGKYAISLILDPKNKEQAALINSVESLAKAGRESAIKTAKVKNASSIVLNSNAKPHLRKNKETGELEESGLVRLTFKSKYAPKVFGMDKAQLDASAVRGGDEVRIQFTAQPYVMPATKISGVTLYANSILLVKKNSSSSGANDALFEGIEESTEAATSEVEETNSPF